MEIVETIKDGVDSVKDMIGDKGFLILLGAGALFGLYNLFKSDSSESSETNVEYVAPTAYSSYPDAVTNANVIIDTLQNTMEYNQDEILENLETNHQDTLNELDELQKESEKNFEETNNYIKKGIDSVIKNETMNFDKLESSIDKSTNEIMQTQKNDTNNILKEIESASTKKRVPKKTRTVTKKKEKSPISLFKKTRYKGNSIVNGLKSIGANSSFAYRKKIAKANGISNYTGTAKQNTKMLNLLKQGLLKKA